MDVLSFFKIWRLETAFQSFRCLLIYNQNRCGILEDWSFHPFSSCVASCFRSFLGISNVFLSPEATLCEC